MTLPGNSLYDNLFKENNISLAQFAALTRAPYRVSYHSSREHGSGHTTGREAPQVKPPIPTPIMITSYPASPSRPVILHLPLLTA